MGKTDRDEDFPVASFLLPRPLRRPVMAFYRFARLADDIADSATLSEDQKLEQLELLDSELQSPTGLSLEAVALRQALDESRVSDSHARDLLRAFRADARGQRCENWDALIEYCRYSAMPVGRFLLALTGDDKDDALAASDALCAALQITNHLKDMRDDYCQLGRLYLPADWLREADTRETALAKDKMDPALRRVVDRILGRTAGLVQRAEALPRHIEHRRLRLQASVSVACADRLLGKLRKGDPMARNLSLGRRDWLVCIWRALTGG